jgi:Ser/Thr protein kinase RdoA (MazF antagonist)
MPQGRAQFSVEELKRVLSHYDIGAVHQTRRISGGSKHAPKLVIVSDRGKYLLKRRSEGKNNLYQVEFTHAIQQHLAKISFPAAKLLSTIDQGSSILRMNEQIYELFEFIKGVRYDGSEDATTDAGRQLAKLHDDMSNFSFEPAPVKSSFHDSPTIRHHLKTAGTVQNDHINQEIRDTSTYRALQQCECSCQ